MNIRQLLVLLHGLDPETTVLLYDASHDVVRDIYEVQELTDDLKKYYEVFGPAVMITDGE